MTSHCWLNGQIIPSKDAQISAFDPGFQSGYAIYETLRTYKGKLPFLEQHLERLFKNLKATNIEQTYSKAEFKNALFDLTKHSTSHQSPATNIRIRITISPQTTLIQTTELNLPSQSQYQNGIPVTTYQYSRTLPQIKSTNMLGQLLIQQANPDFYEILLTENNKILEGTKTNVHFVKDGIIHSPKSHALPGTMQQTIIKLHDQHQFTDIDIQDIPNYEEAFLTNAIIGILPIKSIDDQQFTPGTITQKLQTALNQLTS